MAIDETFEYEALTARVYSRESSTLTIATFTAAASLTFLAIAAQGEMAKDIRIWLMGVAFSLLGIVYRELTVFTMDRKNLHRIRKIERNRHFPQPTKWDKFFRGFRWFVFRCAMISPAVGLVRLWAVLDSWLGNPFAFLLVWLLYPVIVGVAEYVYVDRDRPRD